MEEFRSAEIPPYLTPVSTYRLVRRYISPPIRGKTTMVTVFGETQTPLLFLLSGGIFFVYLRGYTGGSALATKLLVFFLIFTMISSPTMICSLRVCHGTRTRSPKK